MMLQLREDQIVLQDAIKGMAADHATVRADELPAAAQALWKDLTEGGWLSLGLPEDIGGAGGGLVEICLVVEAAAQWGLTTPHLSALVLGAGLLAKAAPEKAEQVLAGAFQDTVRLALAHSESADAHPMAPVTTATPAGGGWRLRGEKVTAFGAPAATHLLVSASSEGAPALFLVEAKNPGIRIVSYETQRGEAAADIVFDCEAPAEALLAAGSSAAAALEKSFDEALAVSCWEALGWMAALIERTAEHLKTREQFGGPLANFQVLRHRIAEMKVAYEDSKAVASLAMLKVQGDDVGRFASGAKARVAKAGRLVAEQAVQLHGGIGVTEEALISTYFRRLTAFEQVLGSPEYHHSRYARTNVAQLRHWRSAVLA